MADSDTSSVNEAKEQGQNKGHRWQPGESGNPKGRPPKGHSITETIRAMMDEKPEIKRALGAKIIQHAMEGDTVAMKLIWNYLDGMPTQTLDANVSGNLTINQISYRDGDNDTSQLPS